MANPLITRRAQVAVKVESAEGTAETLAAADGTMLAYGPNFVANIGRFERDPARTSLGKLAGVIGQEAAQLTWRTELKGSGAVGTAPAWDAALKACGFQRSTVQTIAIGAVSGGPFQPGETITGGTSSGTGRVVGEVRNGAAAVSYVVLTGTLQSGEVLTGGTSGATATTSGSPAASKGFEYIPDSTNPSSVTAALFADGLKQSMYGARGNVVLSAGAAGEPVFLDFSLSGVYDTTADVAMLSPTYETAKPLAFKSVVFSVQGLTAPFSSFNLDMGNTLQPRIDANNAKGIKSVFITDRAPSGSCDPEAQLVADWDAFGKLDNATAGRLYFELPGGAGSKICVALPSVEFATVSRGERNGIAVFGITFLAKEKSVNDLDTDVQIAML